MCFTVYKDRRQEALTEARRQGLAEDELSVWMKITDPVWFDHHMMHHGDIKWYCP